MASAVPPTLKPVSNYLKHAEQLQKVNPAIAYFCKTYAVQQGVKLRGTTKDPAVTAFLLKLMDELEAAKGQLGDKVTNVELNKVQMKDFALKVFKMADEEDLAGNANKNTIQNFVASAHFIEVLSQFGDLETDLVEKRKYAKWKATDITKALKAGVKPKPGPPGGMDELDALEAELNAPSSSTPNVTVPATNEPPKSSFPDFPDVPNFDNSSSKQNQQGIVPIFPDVPSNASKPAPSSQAPSFPDVPDFNMGPKGAHQFPGAKPTPFAQGGFSTSAPNTHLNPTPPSNPTAPAPHNSPAPKPVVPTYTPTPTPTPTYTPAPVVQQPVVPMNINVNTGFKPTVDDMLNSAKYGKFAMSALNFDDAPTAIKNFQIALKILTMGSAAAIPPK